MFYYNITFAVSLQIDNIMITLAPNCKTIHNSEEQNVFYFDMLLLDHFIYFIARFSFIFL